MDKVTIAAHGDLFAIKEGGGYSYLGFDVTIDRTKRYATELNRPDLMPTAPRGTLESYAEYQKVMDAAREVHSTTGKRFTCELSPQLTGLEGRRVEVITSYGETRRFWVGKSTGWTPIHLEIARSNNSGGMGAEREYKSVRMIDTRSRR